MKDALEFTFELRPEDGEEGDDLQISVDDRGVTIRELRTSAMVQASPAKQGYVTVTNAQMREIIKRLGQYDEAAKILGVDKEPA